MAKDSLDLYLELLKTNVQNLHDINRVFYREHDIIDLAQTSGKLQAVSDSLSTLVRNMRKFLPLIVEEQVKRTLAEREEQTEP